MPSTPEITPDSAAGPAFAEPSFSGYFQSAVGDRDAHAALAAELKVYLVVYMRFSATATGAARDEPNCETREPERTARA